MLAAKTALPVIGVPDADPAPRRPRLAALHRPDAARRPGRHGGHRQRRRTRACWRPRSSPCRTGARRRVWPPGARARPRRSWRTPPTPTPALNPPGGSMSHRVTLIPGDGVGPEIAPAARRDHRGGRAWPSTWEEAEAGAEVFKRGDTHGRAARDRATRSSARGSSLKGPLETPGRLRREERQRHAAQAVRDVRQHPPGAPAAGRAHPLRRARASTSSSSARTSRTSTRASSTSRRRDVAVALKIISRSGLGEDHPLRLRARASGRAAARSPWPRRRTSSS